MSDPENLQSQVMQLIMQADFTSIDGSITMMDDIMSQLAQREEVGGAVTPEIEGLIEQMMQMRALAVNTDAALMAKDYDGAEALLGDIEGVTGISYADDPPLSAQADAVIDAIEAGQPARMVDLTIEHWNLSRDRLEQFVSPDPLPLDMTDIKDRKHAV